MAVEAITATAVEATGAAKATAAGTPGVEKGAVADRLDRAMEEVKATAGTVEATTGTATAVALAAPEMTAVKVAAAATQEAVRAAVVAAAAQPEVGSVEDQDVPETTEALVA